MSRKNKIAIAVFVKTPGFSAIKTRLAQTIGKDLAEEFYLLSLAAVKAGVEKAVKTYKNITPYWAVAEKQALSNPLWKSFHSLFQEEGDLGDRISTVYSALLKQHDFVFLIGADCPGLNLKIWDKVMQMLSRSNRPILGESFDGGFYLWGGGQPISHSIWKSILYSSKSTSYELKLKVKALGKIQASPKLRDVDTMGDLKALYKDFRKDQQLSLEQRAVLNWAQNTLKHGNFCKVT